MTLNINIKYKVGFPAIILAVLLFQPVLAVTDLSEKSPFGIHDPGAPNPENDITAIGARWVRYAGGDGVVWDAIERRRGEYDWSHQDRLYLRTFRMGIRMFVSTISANKAYGTDHGRMPSNMVAYLTFLKKAVERYDGDGIDDAPGSPVVEVWQIENEPDLFWKDTPEDFAKLTKESYKVIKKANPQAKAAIAGVGTPEGFKGRKDFYSPLFAELDRIKDSPADKYFEIFDFHWYPFMNQYNYIIEPPEPMPGGRSIYLTDYINGIKQALNKYGYGNLPIFITEAGQYSGIPSLQRNLPPEAVKNLTVYHDEKMQATFLLKLYVYALVKGVDKIFWVTLTEWHNFGGDSNGVFDNVGLINNPRNDGESHKKLAYYTYKKMAEMLEGSDWNNIETIQERDGVCIYKFIRNGRPVWVAWNDGGASREITLPIGKLKETKLVKVFELVPDCKSGKNVADYAEAFKEVKVGYPESFPMRTIVFEIGDTPVFIEEIR